MDTYLFKYEYLCVKSVILKKNQTNNHHRKNKLKIINFINVWTSAWDINIYAENIRYFRMCEWYTRNVLF